MTSTGRCLRIAALGEWIVNGGGPTLRALKLLDQGIREEILKYLNEMELYAEIVVAVSAVRWGVSAWKQWKNFMFKEDIAQ